MKTTKKSQHKPHVIVTTLALVVFAFSSCNKQESQSSPSTPAADAAMISSTQDQPTVEQKQNAQDINNYFLSLNSWSEVAPPGDDGETIKSITSRTVITDKGQENCSVSEVSLTKNPSKIVIQNPSAELLYPGALIQGEGYAQAAGGVRELPIRKRAPIVIATDLVNENSTTTIENLSYATYKQAYAKLVRDAIAQAAPARTNMYFDSREVESAEEGALNLGFSAKYLGQSLKGDLHTNNTEKLHTVMAFFEHRAFTISALAPSTPAGLFSDDFTLDDLTGSSGQESLHNIGPKNPPLFVSNVNYGRLLMFTVTSKATVDEIKGALDAAGNVIKADGTLQLDGAYKKVMGEATVRILTLGGNNDEIISLIKSGNLKDYFGKAPSLDAYEPISYTFRNVIDGSIAKVAESTDYSRVECTPGGPAKAWKVRISIDGIKVKHGYANYTSAPVYGQIKVNDRLVWDYPSTLDFKIMKKDELTPLDQDISAFDIVLPLDTVKKVTVSIKLRENFTPFFSHLSPVLYFLGNHELLSATRDIGYQGGTNDILPDGTYTISGGNADVIYTIKRIAPVYE